MPLSFTNKPQLIGIIVLITGVALLAFTFINAFLFLQEPLSILSAGDLARVFGDALAPLIQACIRLMYLGIMGWIGSLLTIRGIPLVTHRHVQVAAPETIGQAPQQQRAIQKQQPTPKPAPQPAPKPAPQPAPKPTPQPTPTQTSPQPQSAPQVSHAQSATPVSEPKREEPQEVVIPPDSQWEE